jgi:hypothetical protein
VVLAGAPELVELEPVQSRQELYREVLRTAAAQAGHLATPGVLFAVARGEELYAAPALDPRADLLQSWDGGSGVALELDNGPEGWPEDPRESLQGLSERESAALVANSLLQRWGIQANSPVHVERALGAPYAAAYVNGVLRVNPSFVYLAAGAAAVP